ncbi:MAG: endonuclease Q family protein [Patescibacteria group bacterium]|nr:endonuclease Q family protein [Patescibacteria group bacterium]
MKEFITDLHFHSKYSRAVSPKMDLEHFYQWGLKKGLNLLGTSDFTHPQWFSELKKKLVRQKNGFYRLKNTDQEIYFVPSAEISCIYKKNGQGRRIHILIIAPDLETVKKINVQLGWIGNLKSDGRPILGCEAKEMAKIALKASKKCLVIPAHIWTPWFSLFGSRSGFDRLEECFEEYSNKIYAIETGLSSDPPMNWRLKQLDKKAIVSFSDAHSPNNLGREATVFALKNPSYEKLFKAIKNNQIAYTIEFFPQEGKYHWDGHRKCQVRLSPQETKKNKGLCPKCGRKVTVGVMNRVDELADRKENYQALSRPPFKSLVPLKQIISQVLGIGPKTKGVADEYENLIKQGKNEFNVLLNLKIEKIEKISTSKIAQGIKRIREKKLNIKPGFDGQYGKVKVFADKKEASIGQESLF